MSDSLVNLYAAVAAARGRLVIGRLARGRRCVSKEFLARIHAWHALLRRTGRQNFALYLEDSIEFGAALLGAWHAGKTIWLTPIRWRPVRNR
jgi:acyl-CoA synthetase (AMP-forming)/AMP-acid ligase II